MLAENSILLTERAEKLDSHPSEVIHVSQTQFRPKNFAVIRSLGLTGKLFMATDSIIKKKK